MENDSYELGEDVDLVLEESFDSLEKEEREESLVRSRRNEQVISLSLFPPSFHMLSLEPANNLLSQIKEGPQKRNSLIRVSEEMDLPMSSLLFSSQGIDLC